MNKVTITDKNSRSVNEAFGISEERANIIDAHLNDIIKRANNPEGKASNNGEGPFITEMMEEACSIAETENEVAFIAYAFGHFVAEQSNPLMQMLMQPDEQEHTHELSENAIQTIETRELAEEDPNTAAETVMENTGANGDNIEGE